MEKCINVGEIQILECTESKNIEFWECEQTRQERVRECRDWAKEYECCDWAPCSWACAFLVWLGGWICVLWEWITYTFCIVWNMVSYTVCITWAWVTYILCVFIVLLFYTGNEQSYSMKDCGFGWRAAYRIESQNCNLLISVKIRLIPDSSISDADLTACELTWKTDIESRWSNQYIIKTNENVCNCEEYSVLFEVHFVDSNEHHTVNIHAGTDGTDMGNWYINGGCDNAAAHEYGHMIGLKDEYPDDDCLKRTVSDNSIMKTSSSGVPQPRHYEKFAEWISRRTGCTYDVVP